MERGELGHSPPEVSASYVYVSAHCDVFPLSIIPVMEGGNSSLEEQTSNTVTYDLLTLRGRVLWLHSLPLISVMGSHSLHDQGKERGEISSPVFPL